MFVTETHGGKTPQIFNLYNRRRRVVRYIPHLVALLKGGKNHWVMNRSLLVPHRSQWPRGLRCRASAARLLRLWVQIPPWAWMFVCCECCVLSGRGLCDGLITRPDGFYRLWRVMKTMLKEVKINRSNRSATPEATIALAKMKSE